MSLRVCSVPGCGTLVERGARGGRCPAHRSEARRARGDRPNRYADAQRRGVLLAEAYGTCCPHCDELMLPGQALDFGHTTSYALDAASRPDRIEHAACNRAAGARLGQQLRHEAGG